MDHAEDDGELVAQDRQRLGDDAPLHECRVDDALGPEQRHPGEGARQYRDPERHEDEAGDPQSVARPRLGHRIGDEIAEEEGQARRLDADAKGRDEDALQRLGFEQPLIIADSRHRIGDADPQDAPERREEQPEQRDEQRQDEQPRDRGAATLCRRTAAGFLSRHPAREVVLDLVVILGVPGGVDRDLPLVVGLVVAVDLLQLRRFHGARRRVGRAVAEQLQELDLALRHQRRGEEVEDGRPARILGQRDDDARRDDAMIPGPGQLALGFAVEHRGAGAPQIAHDNLAVAEELLARRAAAPEEELALVLLEQREGALHVERVELVGLDAGADEHRLERADQPFVERALAREVLEVEIILVAVGHAAAGLLGVVGVDRRVHVVGEAGFEDIFRPHLGLVDLGVVDLLDQVLLAEDRQVIGVAVGAIPHHLAALDLRLDGAGRRLAADDRDLEAAILGEGLAPGLVPGAHGVAAEIADDDLLGLCRGRARAENHRREAERSDGNEKAAAVDLALLEPLNRERGEIRLEMGCCHRKPSSVRYRLTIPRSAIFATEFPPRDVLICAFAAIKYADIAARRSRRIRRTTRHGKESRRRESVAHCRP